MSRVGMFLVMVWDMGLPSPTVVYYLDTKARRGDGRQPCPMVVCPWSWQGHKPSNAVCG